ncbi:hypothetical protein [Arcanobacterium phocae]|nr:hypothetical protein [Arcanobacterium phocae]
MLRKKRKRLLTHDHRDVPAGQYPGDVWRWISSSILAGMAR